MLQSCGSSTKEIGHVAQGYLEAMGNYKFDDAINFASKETREITIPAVILFVDNSLDSAYINNNTPAKIHIKDILVSGDSTAKVVYKKTTPRRSYTDTLNMVYSVDEGWRANVLLK